MELQKTDKHLCNLSIGTVPLAIPLEALETELAGTGALYDLYDMLNCTVNSNPIMHLCFRTAPSALEKGNFEEEVSGFNDVVQNNLIAKEDITTNSIIMDSIVMLSPFILQSVHKTSYSYPIPEHIKWLEHDRRMVKHHSAYTIESHVLMDEKSRKICRLFGIDVLLANENSQPGVSDYLLDSHNFLPNALLPLQEDAQTAERYRKTLFRYVSVYSETHRASPLLGNNNTEFTTVEALPLVTHRWMDNDVLRKYLERYYPQVATYLDRYHKRVSPKPSGLLCWEVPQTTTGFLKLAVGAWYKPFDVLEFIFQTPGFSDDSRRKAYETIRHQISFTCQYNGTPDLSLTGGWSSEMRGYAIGAAADLFEINSAANRVTAPEDLEQFNHGLFSELSFLLAQQQLHMQRGQRGHSTEHKKICRVYRNLESGKLESVVEEPTAELFSALTWLLTKDRPQDRLPQYALCNISSIHTRSMMAAEGYIKKKCGIPFVASTGVLQFAPSDQHTTRLFNSSTEETDCHNKQVVFWALETYEKIKGMAMPPDKEYLRELKLRYLRSIIYTLCGNTRLSALFSQKQLNYLQTHLPEIRLFDNNLKRNAGVISIHGAPMTTVLDPDLYWEAFQNQLISDTNAENPFEPIVDCPYGAVPYPMEFNSHVPLLMDGYYQNPDPGKDLGPALHGNTHDLFSFGRELLAARTPWYNHVSAQQVKLLLEEEDKYRNFCALYKKATKRSKPGTYTEAPLTSDYKNKGLSPLLVAGINL